MRVSRIIEVGAKWQAASVRSQVMGLGKWAAVRSGSYTTGTCWCLFSATRPTGVECKTQCKHSTADEMKRRQLSSAVERGELSIGIRQSGAADIKLQLRPKLPS